MSGVEAEEGLSERDRIERWRRAELERAGYDREAADVLAVCLDVDLHEAIDLIRKGCSPTVALSILL